MYNKNHNLIFIHIPKTAGTAISEYMYSLAGNRKDIVHHVEMDDGFLGKVKYAESYCHITLPMYKRLLAKEVYDTAVKFVVVRNPINKLKSWYYFHIQNNWVDFSIEEMLPILVHDLKLIESRGYALNRDNREDGSAVFDTFGIMRQTDYFDIKTDGVNIIRYENLQSDFNDFTERYGFPKFDIQQVNITSNKNLSDTEFYNKLISNHPKEMIDYMLNYYEQDFNLLGYKING